MGRSQRSSPVSLFAPRAVANCAAAPRHRPALPEQDPTLRVIASEFALFAGRAHHRPTYDTGRKGHDGTGADVEQGSNRAARAGAPTNRLVADWTGDELRVTFEDLE